MSYEGLGGLVEEIKQASRNIELSFSKMASRLDSIEQSLNELFRKTSRPGSFRDDEVGRAQGRGLALHRQTL